MAGKANTAVETFSATPTETTLDLLWVQEARTEVKGRQDALIAAETLTAAEAEAG